MMKWQATASAIVLSCLAFGSASAQVPPLKGGGPGVDFGPVVNVNFMTLSGKDLAPLSSITQYSIGAALTLPLGGRSTFVQPQLLYSGKGAEATDSTGTAQLKPTYVELSVPFGVYFNDPMTKTGHGGPRFFAMAGPYAAYLSGCKAKGSGGGLSIELNCSDVFPTNSMDFGGVVGAGVEMPAGGGRLSFTGRYQAGLVKVFKDFDARNRGFSIGVGYFFGIGR